MSTIRTNLSVTSVYPSERGSPIVHGDSPIVLAPPWNGAADSRWDGRDATGATPPQKLHSPRPLLSRRRGFGIIVTTLAYVRRPGSLPRDSVAHGNHTRRLVRKPAGQRSADPCFDPTGITRLTPAQTGNSIVESKHPHRPDLDSLIAIFYAQPERLGQFRCVTHEQTPPPYQQLLSHEQHMTVTVEAYHGTKVDVQVLAVAREQGNYCRRIVLLKQPDDVVVQFGIVRLNVDLLDSAVRDQIEEAKIPLGRVLIQNNVMRDVELHQLYQVQCGVDLAKLFGVPQGTETFGRTALIYCNGEPAVELLEIVAPISGMEGNC